MRRHRLDLSAVAMGAMTLAFVAFFGAAWPELQQPHSHGAANLWLWLVLTLFGIGLCLMAYIVWPRHLKLAAEPDVSRPVTGPVQQVGYEKGRPRLLAIKVTNQSALDVTLTAKVRPGVRGLTADQPDYGNFDVGWQGDTKEVVLDSGDHWPMHLAYIYGEAGQSAACFVKPDGSVYDFLQLTIDEPIRAIVDVTEFASRKRKSFHVEFGLESVAASSPTGGPASTTQPFLRVEDD
jgi:hypothetical protein